jgi:hypothetical protein
MNTVLHSAKLVCTVLVLSTVTSLSGCSDPYPGLLEVTGSVKLAGEPLKDGSISFAPVDGRGTQSGAPIVNGSYALPRPNGLKAGKYLVRITAGDGRTPANEEAANPGGSTNIVSVDLIPDEWNAKSTKEVEVKANSVNKFDFEIPTVNPRAKRR